MGVSRGFSDRMFWRLIFRAMYLRMPRVMVVFAALTVGTAIVTAMSAVWFDINAKMSLELRTFGANFYIGPGNNDTFTQKIFLSIIDSAPEGLINAASPVRYGMVRTELETVLLMGVWFESLQQLMPYWQVKGDWIGVSFDNRNAMIGTKLAQRLNVNVGDSIALMTNDKQQRLRIKGIVEAGDATDNMLVVSMELAQKWFNQRHISNALLSVNNDVGQVETFATQLQQKYSDLEFRPIRKVSASEGKVLDKIKGLMGVVSVMILILSSLCVNTTLMAMVSERTCEFALQKALGANRSDIIRQMLTETMIIAFTALVCGMLLGYLLAQMFGQTVFNAEITLRAPVLPLTFFLSLLVAAVATIVPVWRAVHIEPADVLKGGE